jgi:hypothetical protein
MLTTMHFRHFPRAGLKAAVQQPSISQKVQNAQEQREREIQDEEEAKHQRRVTRQMLKDDVFADPNERRQDLNYDDYAPYANLHMAIDRVPNDI